MSDKHNPIYMELKGGDRPGCQSNIVHGCHERAEKGVTTVLTKWVNNLVHEYKRAFNHTDISS